MNNVHVQAYEMMKVQRNGMTQKVNERAYDYDGNELRVMEKNNGNIQVAVFDNEDLYNMLEGQDMGLSLKKSLRDFGKSTGKGTQMGKKTKKEKAKKGKTMKKKKQQKKKPKTQNKIKNTMKNKGVGNGKGKGNKNKGKQKNNRTEKKQKHKQN